ncbi:hypothetical protein [Paracidovorax citrulli]|uniref:hypothetical protein n=1 Tax=Paracidovorax citrulli TaxID=80869 RepID=UPI003FA73A74
MTLADCAERLHGALPLTLLRRVAHLMPAAQGTTSTLVMVKGIDDAYADMMPQLIPEDALRINPSGLPPGFGVDLLDSPDRQLKNYR